MASMYYLLIANLFILTILGFVFGRKISVVGQVIAFKITLIQLFVLLGLNEIYIYFVTIFLMFFIFILHLKIGEIDNTKRDRC